MIKLEGEILRELQLTELELMKEVDRICRKNKIDYSLDGGTLLGAVRHKGFIPWDDDADIMMTRKEYERFYKACKRDLDSRKYFFQEFRTDPEYRWGYAKLRKNGTIFLREGQEHVKCHTGVCIDIFVFDEVPDGYVSRRIHYVLCFIIRKGLYSIVGKKDTNKFGKKMIYMMLSIFPRNFWVAGLMKLAKKQYRKGRKLVSHLTYPNRKSIRFGLSAEYYKDYVDIEFEGYRFSVIKEYDRYLTELFDDYMQLPSKEKRKVHPVSKIQV